MSSVTPPSLFEALECRVCLSAHHGAVPTQTSSGSLTNDDKNFMIDKSVGNLTEARLGAVALGKTTNVALHALAVRLVANHQAAQLQLQQVAITDGVTLPTSPDYKHRKIIRWMSSLSGQAFDEAFANYMVADHHQDIADYTQEQQTTTDQGLVTYTTTQIPVLVRHLGLAKDGQVSSQNENSDGSQTGGTGTGTGTGSGGTGTGTGVGTGTGTGTGGTGMASVLRA